MAYYWRAGTIPELQKVQADNWREWLRVAEERSRPRYFRWASILGAAFAVLVAGQLQDRLHLGFLFVLLTVTAVGAAVGWVWDAAYQQPRARRWLREHLHEFRTDDKVASTQVPRA